MLSDEMMAIVLASFGEELGKLGMTTQVVNDHWSLRIVYRGETYHICMKDDILSLYYPDHSHKPLPVVIEDPACYEKLAGIIRKHSRRRRF